MGARRALIVAIDHYEDGPFASLGTVPADAEGDYQLAVGVRSSPDGPLLPVTSWPERLPQEARRLPNRVLIDSVQAGSPDENEAD